MCLDILSSSVSIRGGISQKANVKDLAGTRFEEQFAQARMLHQQGKLASARRIYLQILDAQSDQFHALTAMGVLSGQSGDLQQAIQYFNRAVAAEPNNSVAHCNLGLVLGQLRQLDTALACFDRAIALDANGAVAHYCRAETCKDLGRTDDALASYDAAVAIKPGFAEAYYSRGVLLHQRARLDAAIASYDQVIRIKPDHFDAHANRALSMHSLGRPVEALAGYDRAIALRQGHAPIYLQRGNVLRELHRPEEALASYDRAIAISPDYAEAVYSRGAVLLALDRVEAAIASFDRAIAIKSDYAEAYFNRGYALRIMNRFREAAADYEVVAALAPDYEFLPGARLEANQQICDWTGIDTLVGQITAGIQNDRRVSHPLILMALIDSPRLQHQAARTWVSHACPARDSLGPITPRARAERLRIGYFSANFHEHPLPRLLAELIEIHDRSRVEVIAFALGPNTHDEVRQRLVRSFDRFIEVQDKSSLEIAALARTLGIDIAVDLDGHTYSNRFGIFALRAAPLQVSYLGYLGTTGADYIDYIVADRTVVTAESECHFSEKIIYLPDCFQVNDRKRRIAERIFTREKLGLPSSGFVFCCLNTNYKILPTTFAAWMRILKRVPGSVLLLYGGYDAVKSNLRLHAARQEVDPQRLIFGERLQPPEYLARYRAADLFLDTLPYNGGTTVSDALWAGLPVLTLAGQAFASRVAASLLTAIDLPELIATTQERYEELAVELALNPDRLAQTRTRLRDNRLTSPLFDTSRFARNLEAAYTAIYDRYQAGLPTDHMRL
jgi:predicted O-linked N-acetylglucosamine transferase (SPINDLY family)